MVDKVAASFTVQNGADDEEWDDFLASQQQGYHEQCSQYGKIREQYGFKLERSVIRENGRIVGGAQALTQSTPVGRRALVLRGPLVAADDLSLMEQAVAALDQLAQQRGYAWMRVETLPTQTVARTALENFGFTTHRTWYAGVNETVLIPLSFSDEELRKRMHYNVRQGFRIFQEAGGVIKTGETSSIGDFYHLYQMTGGHQGFPLFPVEYFEYLWHQFGPSGKAQYFIAYHESEPLAGIFNLVAGGCMYYCWGGINRGKEQLKLRANYSTHLAAISWAREQGCEYYDLVGAQTFKRQFAIEKNHWPLPLSKHYGPLGKWRRQAADIAWRKPILRRLVGKTARRLGLHCSMPW